MSQISEGPVQMFDLMMDKRSEIEEMKSTGDNINNNSFTHIAAFDVTSSSSSGSEGGSSQQLIKKVCIDCGTSKTPLWRGGPSGPKSLCNACGIRNRKRRRALLGLPPHDPLEKRSKKNSINNVVLSSGSNSGSEEVEQEDVVGDKMIGAANVSHPMKLTGLTWQRSTAQIHLRKLGEEEQAAVLLMAMAYGSTSVFA